MDELLNILAVVALTLLVPIRIPLSFYLRAVLFPWLGEWVGLKLYRAVRGIRGSSSR